MGIKESDKNIQHVWFDFCVGEIDVQESGNQIETHFIEPTELVLEFTKIHKFINEDATKELHNMIDDAIKEANKALKLR